MGGFAGADRVSGMLCAGPAGLLTGSVTSDKSPNPFESQPSRLPHKRRVPLILSH